MDGITAADPSSLVDETTGGLGELFGAGTAGAIPDGRGKGTVLLGTGGRAAGDQVAPGEVGPSRQAVGDAGQVQPGRQETGDLRALTRGSDNKHPSTLHCRSPPGGMRKITNFARITL